MSIQNEHKMEFTVAISFGGYIWKWKFTLRHNGAPSLLCNYSKSGYYGSIKNPGVDLDSLGLYKILTSDTPGILGLL